MKLDKTQLKEFLDQKVLQYNTRDFIGTDPIQIPHHFKEKEDIEISGFLIATIAWGNRKSIITNGERLLNIMGNSPFDFVLNYTGNHKKYTKGFVHRTFNEEDLHTFFLALSNIYKKHQGLEAVFSKNVTNQSMQTAIHDFKKVFFEISQFFIVSFRPYWPLSPPKAIQMQLTQRASSQWPARVAQFQRR